MSDPRPLVTSLIDEGTRVAAAFFAQEVERIVAAAEVLATGFRDGRRLFLFGNGGSAADAQHLAAEFVGKMTSERPGLPAIALTTDSSALTSIGNDYGFDRVFSRQLRALAQGGDMVLAISTSGNSPNVVDGVATARELGLVTLAFTGESGGLLLDRVEWIFRVPSRSTQRIQECHIRLGHVLFETVESLVFPGFREGGSP